MQNGKSACVQAGGPDFNPSHSCRKAGHATHACNPSTRRQGQEALWGPLAIAGLATLVNW